MVTLYLFDADGTLRVCHDRSKPCPNVPGEAYVPEPVRHWFDGQRWHQPGSDLVGIVSNQGGVELGYLSELTAQAMLDDLYFELTGAYALPGAVQLCPHNRPHPDRKPNAGMLEKVFRAYRQAGIWWDYAVMVGDMPSDREAAEAAGVIYYQADVFFGAVY